MTVSSESNKVTYSANGATTDWTFSFPGVASGDLSVTITDSDGVETVLNSSLYEVTLNAPISPNPTGIGGSIEYPLSGSPLATGNQLTILRTIPLTQPTSLANQTTLYQPTIEQAFDNLLMQIQQINELLGRQITVAISDDTPTALPPAAQRALKNLTFDADGNPIASLPIDDAVSVSSAMEPVITAASLALGRTAFGLGALSVLGLGGGLENDGANSARVIFTPAADAINQTVTGAYYLTERHATGALTYTLPLTTTLFDGFGFWVYGLTGATTFAIDAADAFSGGAVGTSMVIPAGAKAWVSTDGAGLWFIKPEQLLDTASPFGFQINATVAGNNLTVAIKDRNGNDPTTASPILLPYRDATVANGGPIYASLTSGLSIVAANGASFGATNGVAFRLWLVIYNDGGTLRLGLINCVGTDGIYPLGRLPVASSTQVSATATAAKTFYTQGGAVASKAYAILGYMTWESGLITAGVWTAAPTNIQLFGPNVPLPGAEVQRVQATKLDTATIAITSGVFSDLTGMSKQIDTVSAANPVTMSWQATLAATNAAHTSIFLRAMRGSTAISVGDAAGNRSQVTQSDVYTAGSTSNTISVADEIIDLTPGTGPVTYKLQLSGDRTENFFINRSFTDSNTSGFPRAASQLILRELMG